MKLAIRARSKSLFLVAAGLAVVSFAFGTLYQNIGLSQLKSFRMTGTYTTYLAPGEYEVYAFHKWNSEKIDYEQCSYKVPRPANDEDFQFKIWYLSLLMELEKNIFESPSVR
ncbi:MAG: hypothetical protein AB7W16_19570 [Candidatus Obscuribacterales bacterium]